MTTTLLAIDDSKTMRRVLEITFAGEAYRTVLSDSAADALAKLRTESPAIALVDAGLDGTDGYALCKQLKQAAPRVRVIVLSSKQQPYDRVRGSAAGADDYIDKPFDTQQLLDKVGSLAKAHAAAAPEPVVAPAARPAEVSAQPLPRTEAYSAASAAPELEVIEDDDDELLESDLGHQVAPLDESDLPASIVPPRRTAPAAAAPQHGVASTLSPAAGSASVAKQPSSAAAGAVALGAANLEHKLNGLGLTSDQLKGVLALSREVIEQVVWEVVPVLAETLIKEEISRLTRE